MSRETFAIIVVAALFSLLLLLLVAALIRSRHAAAVFREAAAGKVPRPEPVPKKDGRKPSPVSRREFFRRSLLASIGLFAAQFGAASLAFLWPNPRGGLGSVIDLGLSPEDVKRRIDRDGLPFYLGVGRLYVVKYPVDPVPEIYEGLVQEGLMALYQKCVHLGCRVPFCAQSQWFECPCHGSKYNIAGEYRDGPAPRSLDRFTLSVMDGTVQVDTSQIILGPPRGTETIQPGPEGPFCVTIGGE